MKTPSKTIIFPQIATIILLVFLFWCGTNTISPFLSLLANDINFTMIETSLFLGTMGITRLITQPILGIVLTIIDEKLAIKLSFLLLLLCSLGYLFFDNFNILILCRVVEALAVSFFAIAIRVIINSNFNQKEFLVLNNYYSGAKNFGSFIGPALAGIFIEKMGIKSIFLISSILFIFGNIITINLKPKNSYEVKSKKENSNRKNLQAFYPILIGICILHSLEFFGLGLWLSGWPVYANNTLNWSSATIGFSFSIMAVSSFTIVPLLNSLLKNWLQQGIIIGLLLLAFQPIGVIAFKEFNFLIWISFIFGGVGATVYFSSFHSYISRFLEKREIAIFYGFLGTFSFSSQAVGQAVTPILWSAFSYSAPIILDFFILLLAAFLYLPFFLISHSKKKYGDKNEIYHN